MSISRFDYSPETSLLDTYVPLPFKEMQEGLQAKQQEYETQKLTLDAADKQIKGVLPNVSEYYKDTKGQDVKNWKFDQVRQANDYLDQQKNEIFNKYKNDLTSSEARTEIANFARTAAGLYNEVAPDALNTEINYKESKKKLDEMKGEDQAHRKLEFDQNLYKYADKGTTRLDTSNVIDEHKFEDLDKNFLEGFKADVNDRVGTYINKGLLAKVDYGNKVKELTEKEIGQRYDSFYKTNHLPVVENNAEYDIEHIFRNQKSKNPELTKSEFNKSKSIKLADGKSYTPEEYKNLYIKDDKQRRLDQAKRYAFKEEDKSQSSSFLPGIDFGDDGKVKTLPTPQTYESSGTPTGNTIDFKSITDENSFVKSNAKFPVAGLKTTTVKGNYVVDGNYIDKLQKEFETTTGSKPTSFFGGYNDDFVKYLNNKGINIDNKKDIGSPFYYKDNNEVSKELTKQKQIYKGLEKLNTPEGKKLLTSEVPQFKGVYNLLALKGVKNPTKEQLIETYNQIAPSAVSGVEVALTTEEMDHTVNLINSNLRHYKVYNKQGGNDEGTTINTIPVTYDGTTKTLGEWIGSGGMTFQKLVDTGAISIAKEIDNPNSIGGETIKTTDKNGNLKEYQTGGINSKQRQFFNDNRTYHSNVNNTKDYYNISENEEKGGVIGSSKETVKSDPLIVAYFQNTGDTDIANRLSDGYYETKTKTKTTQDARGALTTIDVVSIYDSSSGKFIGDIPKNEYMEFRKAQYNKGLIGQKK